MFLTSRFGNEQVFIFPFSPSSWCIIYTDRGVFNDNKSLSFVSSLLPLTTRLSVCDCGSISGTCNVILTFHSDTEQVFSLPPRFLFCVFTHCLSTHFSRTTTTRHRQRVSDSCSLAFLSFTVLLRVFASVNSSECLHRILQGLHLRPLLQRPLVWCQRPPWMGQLGPIHWVPVDHQPHPWVLRRLLLRMSICIRLRARWRIRLPLHLRCIQLLYLLLRLSGLPHTWILRLCLRHHCLCL